MEIIVPGDFLSAPLTPALAAALMHGLEREFARCERLHLVSISGHRESQAEFRGEPWEWDFTAVEVFLRRCDSRFAVWLLQGGGRHTLMLTLSPNLAEAVAFRLNRIVE